MHRRMRSEARLLKRLQLMRLCLTLSLAAAAVMHDRHGMLLHHAHVSRLCDRDLRAHSGQRAIRHSCAPPPRRSTAMCESSCPGRSLLAASGRLHRILSAQELATNNRVGCEPYPGLLDAPALLDLRRGLQARESVAANTLASVPDAHESLRLNGALHTYSAPAGHAPSILRKSHFDRGTSARVIEMQQLALELMTC